MRKSEDHSRCFKSFKENKVLKKGRRARQHPQAVVTVSRKSSAALWVCGCARAGAKGGHSNACDTVTQKLPHLKM